MTEVPEPSPGPLEVLVEVVAAGLNRADLLMREGAYVPTGADWTVPLDRVGFEMAGRVRAVGSHVPDVVAGDRVMAQTGGACAELVTVDHRLLLPVPDVVEWCDAAALPSALLTEFDALSVIAELQEDERVLIAGATTGVGLVGVPLARALGAATVCATTRDPAKAPLLRSLGATQVVDTSTERITRTCGPPFDVALDHLGGPVLPDILDAASPRARIVHIGRLAGRHANVDLEVLAARRLRLLGTTFRGRTAAEIHALAARLRSQLSGFLEGHGIRPVLDSEFGLHDAEQAAARLDAPGLTGKVVLRVSQPE